jgi:hypothetical protein
LRRQLHKTTTTTKEKQLKHWVVSFKHRMVWEYTEKPSPYLSSTELKMDELFL